MTEILIKRLSKNISLPKYETDGSSGMDITADVKDNIEIKPGKSEIIPTGLAVSIPKNFEIQIRPRSGLAAKNQISVLNTPGTIDADYRGELKVILINLGIKNFAKPINFLNFGGNNQNSSSKKWVRNDKNDNIKV